MIKITDSDIKRVEDIFFKGRSSFKDKNNERYDFISCIDRSIDVEACPGSGKTTCLIAKIFILSEKIEASSGKGICVLTHTNVAIDEIKKKLGEKANRLFSYPNFFGTIQSFVDRYLTIPWYCDFCKRRPAAIDTQLAADRLRNSYLNYGLRNEVGQVKYFLEANSLYGKITFKRLDNGKCALVNGVDGSEIKLKRPRSKSDWPEEDKSKYIKILKRLRVSVLLESGLISYDDAYFLAKEYITKYPKIKDAISNRFSYVFVDEMQDTYSYQNNIISEVFNDNVIIQRIGDSNQAILNDDYSTSGWQESDRLKITGSRRFSKPIAKILRTVALNSDPELEGYGDVLIPPFIIRYETGRETDVPEKFVMLIHKLGLDRNQDNDYPIKAVGWVGKEKEGLTIDSYFPRYNKINEKKRSHESLKSAILLSDATKPKLFYNVIIDCCLQVLRLANIKRNSDSDYKFYNKTSFLELLKTKNPELLAFLKEEISIWLKKLLIEKSNDIVAEIRCFLKDLLFRNELFVGIEHAINKRKVREYLDSEKVREINEEQIKSDNIYYSPQEHLKHIGIDIGTVHSVKGETHKATLYLETKYHKNCGVHLIDQLIGIPYNGKGGNRKERCLKVAHVGMSRPTHLLCVAIGKEIVDKYQIELRKNGWMII